MNGNRLWSVHCVNVHMHQQENTCSKEKRRACHTHLLSLTDSVTGGSWSCGLCVPDCVCRGHSRTKHPLPWIPLHKQLLLKPYLGWTLTCGMCWKFWMNLCHFKNVAWIVHHMGIDFNHHHRRVFIMCENASFAVFLHVYKKAHAHECYTVSPEWHWEDVTVVLQPTAKITLGSFDTGDSSTHLQTHLASSISISVASLFRLSFWIICCIQYPLRVNAMWHSRLCVKKHIVSSSSDESSESSWENQFTILIFHSTV